MRSAIWLGLVFIALELNNEAYPSAESTEATAKVIVVVTIVFFIMDVIELFK